jgi:hypothetical protein
VPREGLRGPTQALCRRAGEHIMGGAVVDFKITVGDAFTPLKGHDSIPTTAASSLKA